MEQRVGRRAFLGAASGGAAVLAGCAGHHRPPTEPVAVAPGEAWWRAAAAAPGSHQLKPLPYATDALTLRDRHTPGLSAQTVEWHHERHQAGYVKALNAIEQSLAEGQPAADDQAYGDLKRRETFNSSGLVLHELYWDRLTPEGRPHDTRMEVIGKLAADFGGFERWQADLLATASAPTNGWAILALSPLDRRLHNYACSLHELGGVWNARPLLAVDVWEHAYYHDYGPDREAYLQSWLRLVDWGAVEAAFVAAARSL